MTFNLVRCCVCDADKGWSRQLRYHTSLGFPILDSFPRDLFPQSIQPGSTAAIRTALSSTSQIADRSKELQRLVNRVVTIEERETLSNGLGEIGEAYEEGWQSDSDDSDDWYYRH